MDKHWMKFVIGALVIAATLLVVAIVSNLLSQNITRAAILPTMVGLLYCLLIVVAIKTHLMTQRLSRLEIQRNAEEAQRIASSFWRVEDISYETDLEDKRFVLLRLRHPSWNRSIALAIRSWHMEHYEASQLRPGDTIGFEALDQPQNRQETGDISGYLRLRLNRL